MNDIIVRKRIKKDVVRQNTKQTGKIYLSTIVFILIMVTIFGNSPYVKMKYDNGLIWLKTDGSVTAKMVPQSVENPEELLSIMQPKKQAKKAVSNVNTSKLSKHERMAINGKKFIPPPTTLKPLIEKASTKHGVNKSLMKAISYCESSYNPKAKNVNRNGSKDSGVAQINDIHLPEMKRLGLDRNNPAHAYEFMAILIKRNGTRDYKASEACWTEAVKVASK